jgi:hypothetical protein
MEPTLCAASKDSPVTVTIQIEQDLPPHAQLGTDFLR